MKNAALLLVSCLSIFLNSCSSAPKGPICIVGDSGCICFDQTLPAEQQSYELTFAQCKNYVVTTPDYFNRLLEWCKAK